jgi:hypothetical protein
MLSLGLFVFGCAAIGEEHLEVEIDADAPLMVGVAATVSTTTTAASTVVWLVDQKKA